ncbi:hypothetical protein B484DRAFT_172185 [Ochromonadaceae sp. CCMP2298]|nr:hypothetical protein B484DRAFT_172185 [Ochromonadaceae sp. CCMP2298]
MKKNVRTSRTSATPTSYAVSHDKKTGKNGDAGGKMTKFKSFDEIPDSFDAWAGDENERTVRVTAQVSSPVRWHSQQQQQPQHQESYGITKESYGITKESYGITQGMASMSFAPSMSSAPPLPYDHLHSKPPQRQQQQQQQQAPLPPQSKYFDYAEEEEEYGGGGGDDYSENANDPPGMRQAQQPQPQQPQRQGARVGGGGGGGNGGGGSGGGGGDVPPLPYESDSRDSKKQQDSIYFSKKPRPVDFKPYTMKQYKLIQPKEYVEISNIKPGTPTISSTYTISISLSAYILWAVGYFNRIPAAPYL